VVDNVSDYRLLHGAPDEFRRSLEALDTIPVDEERLAPADWEPSRHPTTIGQPFYVSGRGTYQKRACSTLHFEPYDRDGWWIDRTDRREQLPIKVSVRNVWDTKRSIVLRSGSAHNYLRMVEHIVALRQGLGLDRIMVRTNSGDPPLFDVGSQPIIDKALRAGLEEDTSRELVYWTVAEPVALMGPHGSFLLMFPAENGSRKLHVDCAVDFPTAIGKQRIRFDVFPEAFTYGAQARTNCSRVEWWFVRTLGKLFADVRNLGYSHQNILIAGKNRYANEAKLVHDGKSLEAVWHRATLDLVAALSLLDSGRLAGRVVSYKAGHALDVRLTTYLYLQDLLVPVS
jgi:UDP-3-O-acyl-N-acetylglucosamine deacetylase